jgi:hypothetical protein
MLGLRMSGDARLPIAGGKVTIGSRLMGQSGKRNERWPVNVPW